jgi:hypothetical protein
MSFEVEHAFAVVANVTLILRDILFIHIITSTTIIVLG